MSKDKEVLNNQTRFGYLIEQAFTCLFNELEEGISEKIKNAITSQVLNKDRPPANPSPGFYTRSECSKLLRISLPTLDRYTKEGLLKPVRIGRRVFYSLDCINSLNK